jgi:hypothetical protein
MMFAAVKLVSKERTARAFKTIMVTVLEMVIIRPEEE